jgi:Luciferase-like monooxygenase/Patatin phospholipase
VKQMDIGTVGIWFVLDAMTAPESIEFAQKIEKLGYNTLWIPEGFGREPFAHAAHLLAHTKRLIIATGIANIWARDPMTMAAAVMNRLGQLIFASKLKIDQKLFMTINETIDFMQKIEEHIPPQFRHEPGYQNLFAKQKKVDALTVITAKFPDDKANAGDFSEDTIEYRIEAGYEEAKRQKISAPHPV